MNALTVTAAEANRSFSKILQAAKSGRKVIITSHGIPVAELGPFREEAEEDRTRDLAAMDAHWAALAPTYVGPWTREELYERE